MSEDRDDGQAEYERDRLRLEQDEAEALRRLAQTNKDDAELLARASGHDVREIYEDDRFTYQLFNN